MRPGIFGFDLVPNVHARNFPIDGDDAECFMDNRPRGIVLMLKIRNFGLAAIAVLFSVDVGRADDKPKILMFTKSSGYQHSTVARGKNGELGLAERTVVAVGKQHGFDVDVTKDGAAMQPENLKKYAGLFFYTQGDLTQSGTDKQPPMRPEDRTAILDFVKAGGGFIGTHCGGADTFNHDIWVVDGKKPFMELVGGEFTRHGARQVGSAELVDSNFPAVSHMPKAFRIYDEWYAYENYQPNIHVLMQLKTDQDDFKTNSKGLYARPPYPITWCQNYGKGRVFYTGMGHEEGVWNFPEYREMLGKAVLWSVGKIEGDASPNLKEMYGSVEKGLERINPPKK